MCRRQKIKNLDFMKVEKRNYRREVNRRRGKSILTLLPVVLILLYLQNYIYYMEKTDVMERQIQELQSVLMDQKILEEEARLEELYRKLELLEQYEQEAESLKEETKKRPVLTVKVLKSAESAMEGQVEMVWDESYPVQYEKGVLKFTAWTRVPLEASKYIERLEKLTEFENVEYGGFERKNLTEDGGEPAYLFDVSCRLSLPEKREVK